MAEGNVDLTTLVLKVQTDAAKAAEDIKRLTAEVERLKNSANKNTSELNKQTTSLNKTASSATSAASAVRKLDAEKNRLSGSTRGAAGALNKFNGSTMDAVRGVGMLRGALAAVGVGLLIGKITELSKSLIDMASQFQMLDVRMRGVFGGDAIAAEGAGKWLQKFIIETPFQLKDAQQAFIQFKAFGIDPMGGAMQAVADMAARLGGSQETLERITLALGKAFLKNKMQGYELRQMHMAGVPAAELLAESMGVAESKIAGMARAGQIGRKEIEGLIVAMGNLASGQALALVRTFGGAMSNLKDYVAIFAREFGLTSGLLDELARSILIVSSAITGATKDKSAETWGKSAAAAMKDFNNALEKILSDSKLKEIGDRAMMAFGAITDGIEQILPQLPALVDAFISFTKILGQLIPYLDEFGRLAALYFGATIIGGAIGRFSALGGAAAAAGGGIVGLGATLKSAIPILSAAAVAGVALAMAFDQMYQAEAKYATIRSVRGGISDELAFTQGMQAQFGSAREGIAALSGQYWQSITGQEETVQGSTPVPIGKLLEWARAQQTAGKATKEVELALKYMNIELGKAHRATELATRDAGALAQKKREEEAAAEALRREAEERGLAAEEAAEEALKLREKAIKKLQEERKVLENLYKWSSGLHVDIPVSFTYGSSIGGSSSITPGYEADNQQLIGFNDAAILHNYKAMNEAAERFKAEEIARMEELGKKHRDQNDDRHKQRYKYLLAELDQDIENIDKVEGAQKKADEKAAARALREQEKAIHHQAILWGKMFDSVVDNFMDMLINGFSSEGVKNALNDLISGVGSTFADELKKTLGEAMASGDWGAFSFGDADSKKDGFQLSSGLAEMGIAIGAGIMQAGIKEQSAGQAAMGGAITGAAMGAQSGGGWIGAIIGAVAGGAFGYSSVDPEGAREWLDPGYSVAGVDLGRITDPLGLFNPTENPTTTFSTNLSGGLVDTSNQGSTPETRQVFLQEVLSLQRHMGETFREVLMTFGDAALFDLTTPFQGLAATTSDLSMEQVLAQLGEVTLPEIFQENFAAAFQTGLTNLGLTADAIDQLGEDLANLPLEDRLTALMTVVSALRSINDLSEIDPMAEIGMDSVEIFDRFMADATDQVALLSAGWEGMDLAQRAGELLKIGETWAAVLANATQALRALDQMQKQINATFDNAIESIRMNEMTTGQRRDYLTGQIDAGMADLRAADSPEEIQAAVDDVYKYIQMLAQVLAEGYAAAERILTTVESMTDSILTVDPMRMATITPYQSYRDQMGGYGSEVGLLANTIWNPDSDITEVAASVQRISEIWQAALASTVELLRAAEQARTQINQLFDNAILTANMNRMNPAQLQAFNQQRIDAARAVLADPTSQPAELQAAAATYTELLMAQAAAVAAANESILASVELFAELAEVNPLEDFAQSSTDAFQEFMDSSTASVDELMSGFDGLTLTEQANRLTQIGDIWRSVLDNTMQMLQAIDQAQRAMNQNYDNARENLAMGGMDFNEQQSYLRDQIAAADQRLHDPNISLEEAQAASDDLFRYIQMLQQLFETQGDRGMYEVGANGQTYADIIMDLLNQGQAESNRIFDNLRQDVVDNFATFQESLGVAATAIDALGTAAENADPWGDIIELLTAGRDDANAALDKYSSELIRVLQALSLQIRDATIGVEDIADVWVNDVAAAIIAMMEAAQIEANDRIVEVRQGVLDALEAFRLAVLAARDALDLPTIGNPIDPIDEDPGGGGGGGGGGNDGAHHWDWEDLRDSDEWDDTYGDMGKSANANYVATMRQAAQIMAAYTQKPPVVNVEISGSIATLKPYIRAIVSEMMPSKIPPRPVSGGLS